MKYFVFIPVRLASTRLPNKQMKKFQSKIILELLIERIKQSEKIEDIIICTTKNKSDDKLISFLKSKNIKYFRGSEHDLLNRFNQASQIFSSEFIIIVDGDDIYTNANSIDLVIKKYEKTNADYIFGKGYPHGFIPVGVKLSALQKICKVKNSRNTETGYREFFTETGLFNSKYIRPQKILDFPKNLRLTLDYHEDYLFAKKIFSYLGNDFTLNQILELVEKEPELLKIIDGIDEKWKKYYDKNYTNLSIRQK